MSTAAIIGGTAAAGIAGAVGSSKAAGAQADAAKNAANVSTAAADKALDFQKLQYSNSLAMLNPYLQTGYGALGLLRTGLGIGGPSPQGFNPFSSTASATGPTFNGSTLDPNGFSQLQALRNGGGAGGGFIPMQARGGQIPMVQDVNGASLNPQNMPAGFTPNGTMPGQNFGVNQTLDPNDPSFNAGVPFIGNPDAHNFGGGTINASTNIGGTAMVPRADGTDASGNPNLSFGSLLSPFSEQFKAPTVTDDPGYQFRLDQGTNALTNSAAARGGLLTGGFAKGLNDYVQGSASQEYGNAYNRALNEYLNRYNIFTGNQNNQFNKLAAISGLGQTSANQLSTAGLTTGANVGNTLLTSAGQVGSALQNAGAARGSGYAGIANAISGSANSLSQLLLLQQLYPGSGSGGGNPNSGWGVT